MLLPSYRDLITFSIEFDSHLQLLGFSCLKSRKHGPGVDITSLLDVGILLRALALKRSCGLGKLRLQVAGVVLVRIFVFFFWHFKAPKLGMGSLKGLKVPEGPASLPSVGALPVA